VGCILVPKLGSKMQNLVPTLTYGDSHGTYHTYKNDVWRTAVFRG
jgi:hypothetical protein